MTTMDEEGERNWLSAPEKKHSGVDGLGRLVLLRTSRELAALGCPRYSYRAPGTRTHTTCYVRVLFLMTRTVVRVFRLRTRT